MPRSGGTLLYQLTKEIAERGEIATGRGFAKERYHSGVVKTEFCEPWMIDRVRNGGAVAFGSYRDFRDVIVSLRGFYNRRDRIKRTPKAWTVQDVLDHRPIILDSYYGWQRACRVWFRYEDENFAQNIVNDVCDILRVPLMPRQKRVIIEEYSLEANLRRTQTQKVWMEAGPGSMLTQGHISPTRGRSIWREVLSPHDLVLIDKVGGQWLREHGYE
jgi:hypothetical protein